MDYKIITQHCAHAQRCVVINHVENSIGHGQEGWSFMERIHMKQNDTDVKDIQHSFT